MRVAACRNHNSSFKGTTDQLCNSRLFKFTQNHLPVREEMTPSHKYIGILIGACSWKISYVNRWKRGVAITLRQALPNLIGCKNYDWRKHPRQCVDDYVESCLCGPTTVTLRCKRIKPIFNNIEISRGKSNCAEVVKHMIDGVKLISLIRFPDSSYNPVKFGQRPPINRQHLAGILKPSYHRTLLDTVTRRIETVEITQGDARR